MSRVISILVAAPPCRPNTYPPINPEQQARLQRVLEYLQAHFAEHPTLTTLAHIGGLSPFHFHRLFRTCYGKTLKRITTELQVEHAQTLLLQGVSAIQTAKQAGFANQSHLTSRFKLINGIPPAAWLRGQRARAASLVAE